MHSGVRAILLAEKSCLIRGLPDGIPLPLVDVLGSSILQRTIDYLHASGVEDVTVISDFDQEQAFSLNGVVLKGAVAVQSTGVMAHTAEEVFLSTLREGATAVLLARVNAYTELNLQQFVSHHFYYHNRVTRAWCGDEPLDMFLVNASRENGLLLLRSGLRECPVEGVRYRGSADEYVNCLQDARDLRRLASDALHLRSQMKPVGEQIRPGIWVGESARIARGARLVAPVYIGKRAKVRAGAVITRGSSVEHHCAVDYGTVVDNATILPYSQIGSCLDVSNSVVGQRQVIHLRRNVITEIHDARLISEMSNNAAIRTLTVAASLLSFLPQQFWQGLFGARAQSSVPAETCNGFGTTHGFNPSSKKKADLPKLGSGLAVVRRYGNQ